MALAARSALRVLPLAFTEKIRPSKTSEPPKWVLTAPELLRSSKISALAVTVPTAEIKTAFDATALAATRAALDAATARDVIWDSLR